MSATAATSLRTDGRTRPLVAVVSSMPMVFEALRDALGGFADVQSFPAQRGTASLLLSIRPDAAVVDEDEDLLEAESAARQLGFVLVHLALAQGSVRHLRDGEWVVVDEGGGLRPEAVRDVIAAGLYARGQA